MSNGHGEADGATDVLSGPLDVHHSGDMTGGSDGAVSPATDALPGPGDAGPEPGDELVDAPAEPSDSWPIVGADAVPDAAPETGPPDAVALDADAAAPTEALGGPDAVDGSDSGDPGDTVEPGDAVEPAETDQGSACIPNCSGAVCGDDGCGGSCGECVAPDACSIAAGCVDGACAWAPLACDDGDLCSVDVCDPLVGCTTDGVEPGPCSWPGQWSAWAGNPVLTPVPAVPSQGADNIYAPDVLWYAGPDGLGPWWMWYGAQGSDGHDAIFVAHSADLVSWTRWPSNGAPAPVIDHGGANHVNDPSVVRVGETLFLYYTEAPVGEEDEVHLATSTDGLAWTKQGAVVDVGPPGSWEPDRVGRPSVLYEEGEFRMWYDGQVYGVARHVGYATSPDGFTWTKHAANPVLLHEGAIDVERVGPWYVLLAEGGVGTRLYVAKDPLSWQLVGWIWPLTGGAWDQYGQVTPHLLAHEGQAHAILLGGASDACWCHNRVGLWFPASAPWVPQPGCGACTSPWSSCEEACQHNGSPGGECGNPGSVDPGACCACEPATGCEGCLGAHPTCMAACQAAGKSSGFCAEPGSTDPGACCACL